MLNISYTTKVITIEEHHHSRDGNAPAEKKETMEGGMRKAYAALRHGNAGLFLATGEQYRLPERLQKKIGRFARLLIRVRERGCP